MYRGKIVEEGSPGEILGSPRYGYAKKLLESVPKLYEGWFGR